ncbi:MAG: FAD-binding protein [Candidatus Binatia bacterium]|nr:FAD-binding protein [Candidatus Binatia bacterium]
MRIVVFVKQVPEVSELQIDPETRRLRRDGVDSMMNPFDRRAVLEAHRLKGEHGGTITAVTMGPPQAESILRECLGLGADRVVHLSDRGFAGADTLATSRALARATERIGFDLVLAGRYSIDSETGQVGPEVAALLGVSFLGGVRRLEISASDGGWALDAECEGDDGFIEVDVPAPVVVTCTDRWKSRIPRVLPDEDATENGPVEVWSIADLGGDESDYGQAGSPTWVEEVQPVLSERKQARVVHEDDRAAAIQAVVEVAHRADEEGAGRSAGAALVHTATADGPEIWVLGERGPEGAVRPVTWELLAAADRLAASLAASTSVFLLDPPLPDDTRAPVASLAAEMGRRGADVLFESNAPVSASVDVLAAAIRDRRPRMVLAPATVLGRDLVPQLAARLSLGLTGDAIGVELDGDGRLQQLKPAFGGQVVAPILSKTKPEMVTLRPGVLERAMQDDARPAARAVALSTPPVEASPVRVRRFEAEVGAEEAAMEDARVVVCVGFGLGEASVEKAVRLAKRLGGVVAGTRRVCDLKWLARQAQVGLSGRSVAPDLYLAFGVRGSFNHMVGVRRAGTIVAVNNDPKAEIFEGADLGVVGDATAVLDELLSALG